MSFRSDVSGGLHDLQLLQTLDHAHLVNDRRGIHDRLWRMNRLAIQRAHPADFFNDQIIETWINAETVIEHVGAVEKLAEPCSELLDRKSLTSPKLTLRTFNTRATAVPNLFLRISRPHKQCELRICFASNYGE